MGLDAVVNCSCFATGETSPPPVPIARDEFGLPTFVQDAGAGPRAYERYVEWLRSCCRHPYMEHARERIASWGEWETFRAALALAGPGLLPVLGRELPGENSGRTSAEASAAALGELGRFVRLDRVGEGTFLVDTRTGQVVASRSGPGGDGPVLSDSTLRAKLDGGDLVIYDEDFNLDLFRARRLRQVLLARGAGDGGLRCDAAEFTDLDTGETHVAACAIPKPVEPAEDPVGDGPDFPDWEYPELLHVERRPIRPGDFAEIIGALDRIFRASVEVGNPVEWC